jgi:hypothetical protein
MKVPYREDLASHSGPEPHGGCGNTMADAWVGGIMIDCPRFCFCPKPST